MTLHAVSNALEKRSDSTGALSASQPQHEPHPRSGGEKFAYLGMPGKADLPASTSRRQHFATLQKAAGNQAVLRMLDQSATQNLQRSSAEQCCLNSRDNAKTKGSPLPIQATLAVNQPGDQYEQEADRVADLVMRMPDPVAAPTLRASRKEETGLSRKCAECEEEERIQRKEAGPGPEVAPPIVHEVLQSPGQPLDVVTRAFMESRFGRDFANVRVRSDAKAAESAQAVNALAYTVGPNIVFGPGQYSPMSSPGIQLIAHELAHVIQQSGGATPGPANPRAETSVDASGQQVNELVASVSSLEGCGGASRAQHLYTGVRQTIQRQSVQSPRPGVSTSPSPAVVENGQPLTAGQMHRWDFLQTLQAALIQSCDAELRPFGRTAKGCPYILRTIERYTGRPLSSLMRLIQQFAQPAPGADARGLITAVTQRARIVARRLGEKYGQRLLAMTESGDGTLAPRDLVGIRARLGGGRPLDSPVRERMERSFGRNFGSIRLHVDASAARLSTDLGALAFTIGDDIAFAAGHYRPGTPAGDVMIAHELAHTIQQGSGAKQGTGRGSNQELERQANRAASAVVAGRRGAAAALKAGRDGTGIQRWPVIVAGGIVLAEAAPEVIVASEIAAVSTEVVVVDGALITTAELAAPAAVEMAAPAAIETLAPAAVETLAPVVESLAPTVAGSTSVASTAATVGVVAAATLSSDSPTSSATRPDTDTEEEGEKRGCRGMAVGQRGANTCHDLFATAVSGVSREFGLETPEGLYVDFDALGANRVLYEIKTGYGFLLNTSPSTYLMRERQIHNFIDQSQKQTAVAIRCGYPLVWIFNNAAVADFVNGFIQPPVRAVPFPCDQDR